MNTTQLILVVMAGWAVMFAVVIILDIVIERHKNG